MLHQAVAAAGRRDGSTPLPGEVLTRRENWVKQQYIWKKL